MSAAREASSFSSRPEHVTVGQRFQPVGQRQRCIGLLRFPECLSRIFVLEAVQQRDAALKCRLRRVVSGVLEIHGSERVGMRCFLIGLPCDGRRGQTGNQRENSEFHEGPLLCLTDLTDALKCVKAL